MISTTEAQLVSLIISIFAGLAGGCLFDLYRTINYYARPSKAFLYFMDLLFWIVAAVITFAFLLRADFAELRLYTFAGMAIGIFIYLMIFSEYILKFYRLLIYGFNKFFRFVFILMTLPFKLIHNIMWSPVNYIKKSLNKASIGVGKWVLSKLKLLKTKFKTKK